MKELIKDQEVKKKYLENMLIKGEYFIGSKHLERFKDTLPKELYEKFRREYDMKLEERR